MTRNLRDEMSVSDLNKAKVAIVKLVPIPLKLKLSSPSLQQFSPFIDHDGVVHIGGRLNRMSNFEFKNPILLSKDALFSTLVVQNSHVAVGHGGKGFTLNNVRQSGFFIINGVSLVKSVVFKSVKCRRLRAKQCGKKMSDLPINRVSQSAPFENVCCDFLVHSK